MILGRFKKLKIFSSFVGLLILCLITCLVEPAAALSDAERNAISQNCDSIHHSLSQLQKVDSKVRTFLGTSYETVATKFITPLNLRLVKNNRPTLSTIQSEFNTEQAIFRDAYTVYMRELEGLIAMDCNAHPDDFYSQLVKVREERAILHNSALKMNKLVTDQYKAVLDLRNSL